MAWLREQIRVPLPEAFAPNKNLTAYAGSAAWEAFLDYFRPVRNC